ncbi:MAG: DUF2075 domain-containing protein [Spirochaetota bacterium]
MNRSFYSDSILNFLKSSDNEIIGKLSRNPFGAEETQVNAWAEQIRILKQILLKYDGAVYFEFSIPRMGQRIDTVILIKGVIFILEFKVGEKDFKASNIDQVWDYALDLKNFHETSHNFFIAPILIATEAKHTNPFVVKTTKNDKLLEPIKANPQLLTKVIEQVLAFANVERIEPDKWEKGTYRPTPTIIEAAMALYNGHSVEEIAKCESDDINLGYTTKAISEIIESARINKNKVICFVTGVPGSGKTLVGLNIATTHIDKDSDIYSVFLSGNGPLVKILREALIRDRIKREKATGKKLKKGEVSGEVKMFIQNVHNFRDECLRVTEKPPIEHVALFDEAQRAWDVQQTSNFMKRKKNTPNFNKSESEFLISCLDRHKDWAVVVCLVGGGQEINTGEAGISEWIISLNRSFPDWHIHISPNLTESEYGAKDVIQNVKDRKNVFFKDKLHLSVSMRSFRAENVSLLVKQLLDLDKDSAKKTLIELIEKFPIVITRDLPKAKNWLKKQARGSERYGIIVSSEAERLRPYAINIKSPMDPIHWFLNGKEDIRSSYYLEDVATEFSIQGLELDWACVTWDADFRFSNNGWEYWSFRGNKWNHILKQERQRYLKNAYRVLLTRARQGMVIVVPEGDKDDPTRKDKFYDPTYNYLKEICFQEI